MHLIYKLPQKYWIKIPISTSIIYSKSKKIIIVVGLFEKKVIQLKTKVFLSVPLNGIGVSRIPLRQMSINETKKLKTYQCNVISLIKQAVLETNVMLYKKIKLIGVGFKGFSINTPFLKILHLKLGYSHSIYLKLEKKTNFFCFKSTTLFIFGHIYYKITEISSKIRSCKVPEVYKGKGVLYHNEIILLKKGKKI
jgi:large subunit ribosomal protein L6